MIVKNYFKESDIFILPSFTENFGMSILESLMCGCPVIVSKNTPWEDVMTYQCGWWIDLSVNEIVKALEEYTNMEVQSRLELRKQCLKLAANYDLANIGQDTNLAYEKYCCN